MATAKKLPSGSWRCQVYDYTDADGKRHYRSFTAETKKQAEKLAADYAVDKEGKKPIPEYTLNEAIGAYCDLKSNVLSPSTLRGYRIMVKYYGSFGNTTLKKINSDSIQRWINGFSSDHSPKTVKNAYGLIRSVMDAFAPDVRLRVTLPQKVRPELYVPSDGDVQAVLRHFIDKGDKDMEIAVYLAAFGTLRRSEVCALMADDVKDNVVHVHRAMVDMGGGKWTVKTTKTISSDRYIPMPEFVIEKLPKEGNIVNLTPNTLTRRFEEALKKLSIEKFRFHDLRHYSASILHALGMPDQYIMQRGGWSSDQTLKNIYRGIIEDYNKKYTAAALSHFDKMQHEMQHGKEKAKHLLGF